MGSEPRCSCAGERSGLAFHLMQSDIEQTKHNTEALAQLATRLYSAVVSDALDGAGSIDHIMAPRIGPIGPLSRPVIGRAATARAVEVDAPPRRPYGALLEAMDLLEPGHVLVVAGDGERAARSAVFGGLLATAARARGAVGCIVDGAVRDSRELVRLEFPTFATGCSPADSHGRDEVVEHGLPVRCGGVTVHPGDLVVADHDGIVVVPSEIESLVLERALAKVEGEGEMRSDLAGGMSVAEAFAKYGIL